MTNWNKPTEADNYASGILGVINEKIANVAKMTTSDSDTNIPVGFVRLDNDSKSFQQWDGTSWNNILLNGVPVYARASQDVSVSGNVAIYKFDPELVLQISENGFYEYELFIVWQQSSADAQGIRWWVSDTTDEGDLMSIYYGSDNSAHAHSANATTRTTNFGDGALSTNAQTLFIKGFANVSRADDYAHNIQFRFTQETENENPTIRKAGSYLKVTRVGDHY